MTDELASATTLELTIDADLDVDALATLLAPTKLLDSDVIVRAELLATDTDSLTTLADVATLSPSLLAITFVYSSWLIVATEATGV